MINCFKFYINGKWVDRTERPRIDIVNPADNSSIGQVALGNTSDVDLAVSAAVNAFVSFSQTAVDERIELLDAIARKYHARSKDIADAMTEEMGAPTSLSHGLQAGMGSAHFETARDVLRDFSFSEVRGMSEIRREPIGVCGLITPWNWPMNQIGCKIAPAIATGCTSIWKPSEIAPISAQILTEVFDEAGVPAGVINMVHGDGPTVGAAISAHPGIDMVSFTLNACWSCRCPSGSTNC